MVRLVSRACRLAAAGLTSAAALSAQVWEVGNRLRSLPGAPQAFAAYGSAIAVGDLDGDGDDDLVVGAPFVDLNLQNLGAVWVYRGSSDRSLPFVSGVFGTAEGQAQGLAVAIGNFDGLGPAEIAVGVPGADVAQIDGAGKVVVYALSGNTLVPQQALSQQGAPEQSPEPADYFGWRLAVGDFDGDGFDDLAVGVPFEDIEHPDEDDDVGVVHVFYGGLSGLRTDITQTWRAGWAGVLGPGHAGDCFGLSLAAADFDDDGDDDLAIGVPFRDSGWDNSGAVHILYGGPFGLTADDDQLLTDASFPVSVAAANERFGSALAAGRLDEAPFLCALYPCYADLVIGVPGQEINGQLAAGKVWVAYGSSGGVTTATATRLTQTELGSSTGPEAGDELGESLAVGRLDSGTPSPVDLAIGAPGESYGTAIDEGGLVHLAFGAGGGVNSGAPDQTLGQEAGFAIAPAADLDRFGHALAIGDLDGDGWGDLVVGVPSKDQGGQNNSGAVQVLYGALFADGFGRGTPAGWSATAP